MSRRTLACSLATLLALSPARARADFETPKGVQLRLEHGTEQRAGTYRALRKYALVVGINGYDNAAEGIPSLRFASRDAEEVYGALVDPERGAFRPEDVTLLTDSTRTRPTNTEIGRALNRLITQAAPEDMVFLFFSGHGFEQDGRSYLLPANADLGALDYSAIERDAFVRQIDKLRANKVIVVLDACHSGGVTRGGKGVGQEAALSSRYYESFAAARGRAFIASCSGGEMSWEDEAAGHGVFTSSLVTALSGAADNQPADGVVSLDELRRYLESHVSDWASQHGKSQRPQITLESASGDMPVSLNFGYLEAQSHAIDEHRDDARQIRDRLTGIQGLPPAEMADALALLDSYGSKSALDAGEAQRLEFVRRLASGAITVDMYRAGIGPRIQTAIPVPVPARVASRRWFFETGTGVLALRGDQLKSTTSIAPGVRAGLRVGAVVLSLGDLITKGTSTGAYAGDFTIHLLTTRAQVGIPVKPRVGVQLFGGLGGFFGTAVRNDRTHIAYEAGSGLAAPVGRRLRASLSGSLIGSTAELIMPGSPRLARAMCGSLALSLEL